MDKVEAAVVTNTGETEESRRKREFKEMFKPRAVFTTLPRIHVHVKGIGDELGESRRKREFNEMFQHHARVRTAPRMNAEVGGTNARGASCTLTPNQFGLAGAADPTEPKEEVATMKIRRNSDGASVVKEASVEEDPSTVRLQKQSKSDSCLDLQGQLQGSLRHEASWSACSEVTRSAGSSSEVSSRAGSCSEDIHPKTC